MLNKLWRTIGLKQSAVSRLISGFVYGSNRAQWTPADYANLAREGYSINSTVFRCVDLTATAAAGIDWCLYRDKYGKQGKREEIENPDHPLLQLINRPNPLQGRAAFVTAVVSAYRIAGNAYIERVGPNSGPPRELWAHRPDRVRVIAGDRINPIAGYEYTLGEKHRWKPEQILHWKTYHPLDDWYGLSPLEAAARSIDQNNASRAWNTALVQQGGRPPLWINFEESLTPEQFAAYQQFFDENIARPNNAGRPFITDGGKTSISQIAKSPAEMEWLGGLKMSKREICEALGVPSELLGDGENKTYANYGEARKAFYEETVCPLLDSLRDQLNLWLTPLFGERLYLDYDRDDIEALQEDADKVHARARENFKGGLVTQNEARDALGYDEYEDPEADKLYLDSRLIPIDAVSVEESSGGTGGNPNTDKPKAA